MMNMSKSLGNTTVNYAKKNVKDIVFWGNGDTFKLISKASSGKELWTKSTKAMEIAHIGCVIQVTTQQGSVQGILAYPTIQDLNKIYPDLTTNPVINWAVSEAVAFVPGVRIKETLNDTGEIVSRKLVKI